MGVAVIQRAGHVAEDAAWVCVPNKGQAELLSSCRRGRRAGHRCGKCPGLGSTHPPTHPRTCSTLRVTSFTDKLCTSTRHPAPCCTAASHSQLGSAASSGASSAPSTSSPVTLGHRSWRRPGWGRVSKAPLRHSAGADTPTCMSCRARRSRGAWQGRRRSRTQLEGGGWEEGGGAGAE
jgi:hypothetical protein